MSFYYWQDAIDPKVCKDIINEFDDETELKADTGNYLGNKSLFPEEIYRLKQEGEWDYETNAPMGVAYGKVRKTKLNWLQKDHSMNEVLLRYVLKTNLEVWHYELSKMTPCQFGKYEKENFYAWHQDSGYTFAETEVETRKLSLTLQLSNPKDYKGGEFQFWNGTNGPISPPIASQGSILIFDSRMWHQVTPITEGIRFSLVSWILGPAFK